MNDIKVTIRCITYNHGKFIRQALDSFLMQRVNFKYEIVIHDDASTDDTADIIREYEAKYPEIIKAVYQTENQYSKNKNISRFFEHLMEGEYTAFCEGDDFWTDADKLQLQVDYLEAHPECSFTFHNAEIIFVDGTRYKQFLPDKILKSKIWKNHDLALDAGELIELGFIPTASIVARTELVKNRVPFCEHQVCGDLPLRLFLSLHGNAYYFNKTMSAYRIGNINSASGQAGASKEKMKATVDGHIAILDGFNNYTEKKWEKQIRYDIERRKLRYCVDFGEGDFLNDKEFKQLFKTELTAVAKIKYYLKKHGNKKVFEFAKKIYLKFVK